MTKVLLEFIKDTRFNPGHEIRFKLIRGKTSTDDVADNSMQALGKLYVEAYYKLSIDGLQAKSA